MPALQAEVLNTLREYGDAAAGVGGTPTTSGNGTPHGLVVQPNAGANSTTRYSITTGGHDYWGGSDHGAFAFDSNAPGQSGDFSAIVRSVAVAPDPAEQLAPEWGRTGIGVRATTLFGGASDPTLLSDAAPRIETIRKNGDDVAGRNIDVHFQGRLIPAPGADGDANNDNFDLGFNNEAANVANGSVRNTPIWLGIHRYGSNYYSTWAPDNAGTPGTWSSALVAGTVTTQGGQQVTPPPELLGTVQVGLIHQTHYEGNPRVNTAVFDNFRVDNEITDPNFSQTLLDRGQFPVQTTTSLALNNRSQVTGQALGRELGYGPVQGVSWCVQMRNENLVSEVPGLRYELYSNQSALNSDAAWDSFLAGNPVPTRQGTMPNQGDVGGGISPGIWYGNANSGINFYPAGWSDAPGMTPPAGDGASNYGVRLVGEIFLPEAGNYSFKDGVDDYTYLEINGQVLIDDNNWTNATGVENGGSPIVSFNAPAAGWYTIEMRTHEGGGGDNAALYWNYDPLDLDFDGIRLADNPQFPAGQTAPAGRGALVPYENTRSFGIPILEERCGTDIVNNGVFSPNNPIVVPNDGQTYTLSLIVNGAQARRIQVQGIPEPGSVSLLALAGLAALRRRRA